MNEKKLSIRINEELDNALRVMRDKTNLSLNALVNIALTEYVEKWNRCVATAKKYAQKD